MPTCPGGIGSTPWPYVTCWKTPDCNVLLPGRGCILPSRADFCRRYGAIMSRSPSECCRNLCPVAVPQDPCPDIHNALRSLDHFTAPPLFTHGSGTCSRPVRIQPPSRCGRRRARSSSSCAGLPQLPAWYKSKPNPYAETICGLCSDFENCDGRQRHRTCVPNSADADSGSGQTCGFPELPFEVYMADTRSPDEINPPKPVRQVERCLHPSKFRYMDTSYKSDFLDFFKMKSPSDLSLYRSGPAIDHSRPRLTLPGCGDGVGDGSKIILDRCKPVTYHARPIKYKAGSGANTPMKFTVSVPGPITIG